MSKDRRDDEFAEEPLPPEDEGPRRPARRKWSEDDEGPPPKKSNKTLIIVLSVVGGVVVLCLGCVGVGFWALQGVREAALKTQHTLNIKQIGLAYHSHIAAKVQPPQKAEDLAEFVERDPKIMAMLNDGSFVLIYGVRIPQDMPEGTDKTVLGYEQDVPEKGGMVLLGDASVKKWEAAEFAKLAKPKKSDDQPKIDATRVKVKTIQAAAQAYHLNNNAWPATLMELTVVDPNGRQPVLRPADVMDAWGNEIIIDASQADGARPLIYSNGPPEKTRRYRTLTHRKLTWPLCTSTTSRSISAPKNST